MVGAHVALVSAAFGKWSRLTGFAGQTARVDRGVSRFVLSNGKIPCFRRAIVGV